MLSKETLKESSIEFSKFLECNIEKRLKPLEESIEGISGRLEEYRTLLGISKEERTETTTVLNSIIDLEPQLDLLFQRIDGVDFLVNKLKDNLLTLENKVEKVELSSTNNTNTKVTSVLSPSDLQHSMINFEKQPEDESIDIVNTSEFFVTE